MKTNRMKRISRRFRRFLRANEAVSAMEYSILAGVIVVGIGAAVITFGNEIEAAIASMQSQVTGQLNTASGSGGGSST